jgi:hypothetical protein
MAPTPTFSTNQAKSATPRTLATIPGMFERRGRGAAGAE